MIKTCVFLFCILLFIPIQAAAQSIKSERVLHQNILKNIKDDIKEKYYDAKMHGIDIEANYKQSSELIEKATSTEELTDIIARFLIQFDDSHLFFLPPPKTVKIEYGWEMQLVGDKVFVTEVKEESDAFKKGVRPGDQIYMLDGFIPTRKEFDLLKYHYRILRPQPVLNILLIKPNGNKYKLVLNSKIIKDSVFMPSTRELNLELDKRYAERTEQFFYDKIPDLSIWKMPSFALSSIKTDKMIDKVKKSQSLILDLRGNRGGLLYSLAELAGNFFDKEITIGVEKERKGSKTLVFKPSEKKKYAGKLVVLIDSESASASEIFARIIQLEKRGVVIGDQSAGAVMESQIFTYTYGISSPMVPYGVSLTTADLIMKDGQRLEKIGVTPDEKILPTAADLANHRDPVLARAAAILGFQLTAEEAGNIFDAKK